MIKIICVGKLKEQYIKELVSDYLKRVNKYHKVEILELPDSDIEKEGLLIEKHLNPKDFIVTLEIEGTNFTSKELSANIDKWLMNYGNIIFIIGGSDGISDKIKQKSNYKLSFSNLTFPHGLFRGLLLEQIYRSFKILNNESYHK